MSKFEKSDSWVVLSNIEKQIKEKIERIGTPLNKWDISINYGIKTGFNDAFIITGEKRRELIEQDPKSEEIIRPILRGRDIKRYSYDYADLYIITTFPSLQINIELYPAVKAHLLTFGYDRLKQTGDLGARKKTNNQWFETQDTINYWDDFYKQKIVWGNLNLKASYSFAPQGYFVNAPSAFIVSESHYLLAILNSRLADYFIRSLGVTRNGGYFEYKPMFIEQLPVPLANKTIEDKFIQIMSNKTGEIDIEKEIDDVVFELYEISDEEKFFIINQ